MLEDRRTDLLLTIARYGLRVVIALMGFAIIAALGMIVALLFFPSPSVSEQFAAAPTITVPLIIVAAGIIIVVMVLSIRFALELGRIVRTVQQGDPFEPENAQRLRRMGWLALGVTVSGWLLMPLVSWLAQFFDGLRVNGGPDMGGLILAATLFILARVFRHGTAMREDLEGTV